MAAAKGGLLRPWERLEGKVVMVTGASSGIGRELCLDLAAAGCLIVATARRTDRLCSLCNEINGAASSKRPLSGESAVRAVAVELDVSTKSAEMEMAVQKAWDAFGRIDTLINNAGVRGIQRGHLPGGLAYGVSKTGVNTLTKVMAMELGMHNIRVNSIAPGLFKSEITEGLMQKEWLNKVAMKTVPLRTLGTINPALTSLIRYLIHDSSEYVSGNIFIVDAGATLPGVPIFSSL